MKRRDLLATGAGLLATTAGCASFGSSTPESQGLTLTSLDVGGSPGGPVPLRPPGTVVLLDFFATWCAPCKPEMKHLRAVRDRYDPENVWMVSITPESDTEAIKAFWRKYEGTWPVVTDPDLEAADRYDGTRLPTIVVLTPDGDEVLRNVGLTGEERMVEGIETALDRAGSE